MNPVHVEAVKSIKNAAVTNLSYILKNYLHIHRLQAEARTAARR